MIASFDDKETARIWKGKRSRRLPPDMQDTARRKLRQLAETVALHDLRMPRGNRFEQLKGRTERRYSLRINDQWRICFDWEDGNVCNVAIEDDHRG